MPDGHPGTLQRRKHVDMTRSGVMRHPSTETIMGTLRLASVPSSERSQGGPNCLSYSAYKGIVSTEYAGPRL